MYAGLTLVTPPTGEPVSVADALAHSRVTNLVDNAVLAGYLVAARLTIERIANKSFMPQTWRLALKNFPGRSYTDNGREWNRDELSQYYKWNYIEIPRPPLVSIVSFTYQDTTGALFNMTQGYTNIVGNYLPPDLTVEPCRLYLPFSGLWPPTVLLPGSPIQITFDSGYSAFSGLVNTDAAGTTATYVSGSAFDPSMVGTFIQIAGASSVVTAMPTATTLTLAQAVGTNLTNAAYTANAVPHYFKQAILMQAAYLYQNREAASEEALEEIPFGVQTLLDLDRNFHPLGWNS